MKRNLLIAFALLCTNNLYAQPFTDNVYGITESLITPATSNTLWSWAIIENLPVAEYESSKRTNKYSAKNTDYELSRTFPDGKEIAGYGNKNSIDYIIFTSTKREDQSFWDISQIVNPKNIKTIKSNCNLRDVRLSQGEPESHGSTTSTLNKQTIFKWQRKGAKPLYIAEISTESTVTTSVFSSWSSKVYVVAPSLKKLTQSTKTDGLWVKSHSGKSIKCTF